MKYFLACFAIIILGAASLLLWHTSLIAIADDSGALMTEAHIARIRANCAEAQSTLNQIHTSDALLRVNRGQLYESISTKLMEPFDSRILLTRYNGAALVATAADYERELADFRANYQQYDEAMSNLMKINCSNEPVQFYDAVSDARTKRNAVHSSTQALDKTIQDYSNNFEALAKVVQESHQ